MMESEEQWSRRDFTQIKPRRPEGAESCTEDHWEDSGTFSFLWGGASGVSGVSGVGEGGGGGCGGEDGINVERDGEMEEEFEFSSVMTTSSSVVVERSLSPPDRISPADELFFKGQLLPLHLPPRIQMVKKLVLERQHGQREYRECSAQEQELQPRYEAPVAATTTTAASEGVRNSTHRKVESMGAMNALSQARFARLFQPKYSKFCNFASSSEVVAPAPAPRLVGNSSSSWWDPRDSSHHGHHEYSSAGSFTSTDRDSSGDSSSSRDSNGSSQDCFDSGTKEGPFLTTTTDHSKGFFHNREVFSTHSAHPDQRSGNGISTWLRPPFKWKVLFGAKKPSTSKPLSSPYDIEVHPRAQSMEAAGLSELAFSPSPGGLSADRYYSDCSGELTYSGDLLLSSRTFVHGTGDVMDQKYPSRGMERARGYLQKYIQKALKNPSRSKEIHHHHHHSSSHVDDGFPATSSPSSSSSTSAASSTTRGSPAITTSKMFPPFSQSFRFSPKDIPLRMKRPPPPSPSPSPLPGPRRVSTSSASSELHCDIKGAIAHCKESQQQVSSQRQQDDDPSSCVLNRPKVSTSD